MINLQWLQNHGVMLQITGAELPWLHLSLVVRKLAFYICENKGADQLRSNCTVTAQLISAFVFAT